MMHCSVLLDVSVWRFWPINPAQKYTNLVYPKRRKRHPLLSKPIRRKSRKQYPVATQKRKGETLHRRGALMSVTKPCICILPSRHQDECFDLLAATWYAALPYMVATCHCPPTEGQRGPKPGMPSRVVFLSSAFKSTLQRAPLWPLMHPVHLAKQSCETQDHRHGQKQFHSLIEPISTLHFERKQEFDMLLYT